MCAFCNDRDLERFSKSRFSKSIRERRAMRDPSALFNEIIGEIARTISELKVFFEDDIHGLTKKYRKGYAVIRIAEFLIFAQFFVEGSL